MDRKKNNFDKWTEPRALEISNKLKRYDTDKFFFIVLCKNIVYTTLINKQENSYVRWACLQYEITCSLKT